MTSTVLTPPASIQAETLAEWIGRVHARTTRVGIIGLGYVGLPLTLLFSEEEFEVTGFDIDRHKVEMLARGESYIHRIEAAQIDAARRAGFLATTDFSRVSELDAVLICVPTPLHEDHTPDLSFVTSTMESIAPHLQPGQLVVLESTTYPGTTEEIVVRIIERFGVHSDLRVLRDTDVGDAALSGVMVAFSPEREDPGNLVVARRDIPKLVGGVDSRATAAAQALYGAVFNRTVPMSSPAAAEMAKLLENIYRSVNIALVNEFKQMCQAMDIDPWEVIAAAATKPFGFQPFQPGPGVGGHCIPVDPFYLTWKARQFGFATRFIELAGEVNESMPAYVVEATQWAFRRQGKVMEGASMLVLGIAYKRDVDDLRESPALKILELLQQAGCMVAYHDPFFPTVGHGRKYKLDLVSTSLETLEEFDCVLIVTDHSTYDYKDIVARSRLVIDSRNATQGIESTKIVRC